jgi:Putative redox-active protein (C_GCAxxG_C_C)
MSVVDDSFGYPLKPEEHAVSPLAGGLVGNGYQCGMLWGAALAAGAQAYRLYGAGPQAEAAAVMRAQRLVEAFRQRNRHIDCSELTEMNWNEAARWQDSKQVLKFFLKGGPIACFSMSASFARIAFGEIQDASAGEPPKSPQPPVSCVALLAQKMGATEMQTVMAAGFAGGIGLSGSACGALGAAIWLNGLSANERAEGTPTSGDFMNNPQAAAVIEKFLASADYEFECAKIAGRRFENAEDHAAYLREGGCSGIIEALATR